MNLKLTEQGRQHRSTHSVRSHTSQHGFCGSHLSGPSYMAPTQSCCSKYHGAPISDGFCDLDEEILQAERHPRTGELFPEHVRMYKKALVKFKEGLFLEASELADKAAAEFPYHVPSHYLNARCFMRMRQWKRLTSSLSRGIKDSLPDHPSFFRALPSFLLAVPDDADVESCVAVLLSKLHERKDARTEFCASRWGVSYLASVLSGPYAADYSIGKTQPAELTEGCE